MTESAGALSRLSKATGVEFKELLAARRRTDAGLASRRAALESLRLGPDVAVVLMGSWGRRELTLGSDDDFLVLTGGSLPSASAPLLAQVRTVLGAGERAPGPEGIFNTVVPATTLVEEIGLERDTNQNLTRRLLLLLESIAAVGESVRDQAVTNVLERYLEAVPSFRPPRFLLNDVIRYWRTIGVDFEAKDRDRAGKGWGLRNAKLRNSRKLLFAGGLLPVLECYRYAQEDMIGFLRMQFAASPTDRLADAFLRHAELDAGARALGAYDRFVGALNDEDFRAGLGSLTRTAAESAEEYLHAKALGREFHAGLLALLFDNPELAPLMREFAVL